MDPLAWLRNTLDDADPDLLREMVRFLAEHLMSAEVDGLAGAPHGARSAGRINRRNGYRGRRWDTRAGTIDLRIPKLRQGSYFPPWLLERRRRSERALLSVITQAYVEGVSTPRVEDLVQAMNIDGISKSQVSEIAAALDAEVESFRRRPLDGGPYRHLWLDALPIRRREAGRIVSVWAVVGTAVNRDGRREILGVELFTEESGAGWTAFLRDLVARGLSGTELDQRCAPRAQSGDRRGAPGDRLATLPHALHAQPAGQSAAERAGHRRDRGAHHLRPARCRLHASSLRAHRRAAPGPLPRGKPAPSRRARGSARVHQLRPRPLAPNLVEQPAGAPQS
jgi:hypothetical protein